MLAGGVGITPFLSILDWLKSEFPNRRTYLFWSVSYAKEAFCCDALADYGDALPNFTSVVCVTKEDAEGLVRGRITSDLLVKYLSPDVIASGSFLLCGPPAMMESTAEIRRQLKIDENRIRLEKIRVLIGSHTARLQIRRFVNGLYFKEFAVRKRKTAYFP